MLRRPRRFIAALAMVALGTFFVPEVPALSVRQITPEQVLANSDMIIVGTVIDSSVRWTTPDKAMAVTDYRVRLDRIIHDPKALFGTRSVRDEIVLTFAGGQIGDEGIQIPGIPTFKAGEEAVFFIRQEDLNTISPVLGAHQGLYRAAIAEDGRKIVTRNGCAETSGTKVYNSFFSEDPRTKAYGFDEFVAEVERALPVAKKRADLRLNATPVIPEDKKHLIFTGDQIPSIAPLHGPAGVTPKTPTALPASDADNPASRPSHPVSHEGPSANLQTTGTIETRVASEESSEERYRFLWGVPDPPRTYNIPPAYGGWGTDFEYSLSDWNVYSAGTFNKFSTGQNTFGKNSRNDLVFESTATFQSVYGISLGSDNLGFAMMYNSSGNQAGTGQKVYETDVFLNSNQTWTTDYNTAYNSSPSSPIYFFRSTVIHELGHTFGREHTFTESTSATWNSVMNYAPGGAVDTVLYKPFGDDAESIRAAYPARVTSLTDMGAYMFRTTGTPVSGGSGITVAWATFPSSVQAGNSFTLSNYLIENLGTTAQSPSVTFYLGSQRDFGGSYYSCGTVNFGSFGRFSQSVSSSQLNVPASVPPGTYYVCAYLPTADGNGSNQAGWSLSSITVTARPAITLSTSSLSPSVTQGQNASSQSFSVRNSGGGTLNYSISDNAAWLSVSPSSGSSTGEWDSITVNYSTSGLSAGTHTATISISDSGASNSPQTVSVTLTVAGLPTIERSTNSISQSVNQGQNAASQSFTVRNSGSGTLNYSISDDAGWLSVSPSSGTSTGESDTISVTYSTSGLSAGNYSGTITISASGASNSPMTVLVNMAVTAVATPTIERSTGSISQSVTQGQNAVSQSFTVRNSGSGTLSYSISDDVAWLSVSPSSGTSTGESDTITVTYSTSGLAAGNYTGIITITAPGATNSPLTVGIGMAVNAVATPTIERSPSTINQSVTQGQNAVSQSFTVRNSGSGTLSYSISDDSGWLSVSPASGTSTGESDTITVNYSTSALAAGNYTGIITITASGATNSPLTVGIGMAVTAPGGPSNDQFANRITLSGDLGDVTGTNIGATAEGGEPEHQFGIPPSKSVWYRWTAPSDGQAYFTTIGSEQETTFDTYMAAYIGSTVGSLAVRTANDNYAGGQTASLIQFATTAGTEYQVVVDGARASSGASTPTGNFLLTYGFTPATPSLHATVSSLSYTGRTPPGRNFSVYNASVGSGAMTWTASVSYQSGQPTGWLSVSPTSGSSTANSGSVGPSVNHTATVNAPALPLGNYNATITLTSPQATNSPLVIPVTLAIVPYEPMVSDVFESSAGWGPTGSNTATYSTSHDTVYDALRGSVVAGNSTRIIGWLENQATGDLANGHLKYSQISPSSHVRAKFHVYAGGQQNTAEKRQIPNVRLRITSRFAFASLMEIFHHNTDFDGTVFSRDLVPSTNPAMPSIYRVDLDPPELPYLVGNTTEGLQRMFETYSTAGEPTTNGYLALTESSIGVYPAPAVSSTDPSVLIKTYSSAADFSRMYYDLRQLERGSLTLKAMNSNGNNAGGTFGGVTWTGVPAGQITATSDATGVTVSTVNNPDTLIGIAAVDWLDGNAADANHTLRTRIEENKQYSVRFYATATGASSNNALLRFRLRTAKFNVSQRLEVGGAWNLSTWSTANGGFPTKVASNVSHILAHQYLPGTGGWMAGNPNGAIYDVLMVSPLSKDIRPDVSGTIEQRMPNLANEDGPGEGAATRSTGSRRDLFPAIDIVDSLSSAYYLAGTRDPAEKGNVKVSRIEIRKFDLIAD